MVTLADIVIQLFATHVHWPIGARKIFFSEAELKPAENFCFITHDTVDDYHFVTRSYLLHNTPHNEDFEIYLYVRDHIKILS